MYTPRFKQPLGILFAGAVFALTVACGARLIDVSSTLRAERARADARLADARYAGALEKELQGLVAEARRAAAPAAGARESNPWITQAVAGEIAAADSKRQAAANTVTLFGPMRIGSQWVIAARAPIDNRVGNGGTQAAWSVAYRTLDKLFTQGSLGHLANEGYDYELFPNAGGGSLARPFLISSARPLEDAVQRAVRPPPGVTQRIPDQGWALALRPRAGWFPVRDLMSQFTLLTLIAWSLALVSYDISRRTIRLTTALAVSRRRAHSIGERLAKEIEARDSLQKSFDFARYHDAFTGLPNRRYFMDQLDRGLRLARTRRAYGMAVMLVEVNRFTLINELMGQTAGDELMIQVARRFAKTPAAAERVIARWSGEQFAVLLFDLHSIDTAISTAKLLQETLRMPFELRNFRVSVAAGIGATWISSGLQRAEDVLREAAIALSAAKTQGGAHAVTYDKQMRGEAESLVHLEADLHVALERSEFRLLFQPIIAMNTNRTVGVEALLRWHHPIEGLLTPDRFLSVAEETGVLVPLTRWVIDNACCLARDWRRRLPDGTRFFINVNLSASALRDPGLADFVAASLRETAVPASCIRFDISECSLIGDLGASRELLDRLHKLGLRLMLDDFGTGYTSLSYLQFFPFDFLKIDRTFVHQLDIDGGNNKMLRAMMQMASQLGLGVIAEGVETTAALTFLRQIGCRFAQGRLFGEPVTAEGALQLLRGQGRVPARRPDAAAEPSLVTSPTSQTMLLAKTLPLSRALPLAETLPLPHASKPPQSLPVSQTVPILRPQPETTEGREADLDARAIARPERARS